MFIFCFFELFYALVLFYFVDDKLFLVATDSYRLAEKEINVIRNGFTDKNDQKIIVPAKTIQELLRILGNFETISDDNDGKIKIFISENQILFNFASVEMISRVINGNYPDYKQIIPTKSQTMVLIDRVELIRAVKAASLFTKTGINDITMIFSKNKAIVSSFSGANGESQIEISSNINGDDNELTVNYKYLLDGLNNIDGQLIRLNVLNNSSPCIILPEKDDSYLYIVMPIRQ